MQSILLNSAYKLNADIYNISSMCIFKNRTLYNTIYKYLKSSKLYQTITATKNNENENALLNL